MSEWLSLDKLCRRLYPQLQVYELLHITKRTNWDSLTHPKGVVIWWILLRWLWRTSCATRGRTCLRPWSTSRDAGAGACASIRPFGWHLDLAKLYFDLQQVSIYDNNNIRIYIYIVVIFFSCSIFFLWDTVRWSIHFCFKQDFRSWDGHLTWDGTSNARLQGLGSMGTRAPGRWLGYAKFRFYRLVDRGWMDVEGISVTLWDVLISFDDLEGVSSNIRS